MKGVSEKIKGLILLIVLIASWLILGIFITAIFFAIFVIWEVITRKLRKKKLKQTGKRIKSYNIE